MSSIDNDHPVSPLVTTACCLSIVSCLLAVATMCIFRVHPTMQYTYHRLAVILAFNDIIPALFMMISFENHTAGCWMQGTFLSFFQIAGMITIMQMAYSVRYIMTHAKIRSVHWLQTLVLIYVPPLIFCVFASSVTNKGKEDGFVYCWYVSKPGSRVPPYLFIWGYFAVSVLCLIVCVDTIRLLVQVSRKSNVSEGSSSALLRAQRKIRGYIFFYILSYTPLLIRHIVGSSPASTLQLISDTFEACNGMMNALLFLLSSKGIRNLWYDLLHDLVSGTCVAVFFSLEPRGVVSVSNKLSNGTIYHDEDKNGTETRNILHTSDVNSNHA